MLLLNRHAGDLCTSDSDCGSNTDCIDSDYDGVDDECSGYDVISQGACGTSYSAPTVEGAAVDLIDFYRDNLGNDIDDPGFLAANLLLMGDRQKEGGGKHDSEFSNLWGSGRLKMRRWDDEGLDTPADFVDFETCIDDGQNYDFPIAGGGALSGDVDVLKAVLFFYDSAHEWGSGIDNIDIYLQEDIGQWVTRESSTSSTDEKERVFWNDFSGANDWRLRIAGLDVEEDNAGCGTDSQRVYVALFFEDSDRDDDAHPTPNGPGDNTDLEDL